jgi:hypothetical protein
MNNNSILVFLIQFVSFFRLCLILKTLIIHLSSEPRHNKCGDSNRTALGKNCFGKTLDPQDLLPPSTCIFKPTQLSRLFFYAKDGLILERTWMCKLKGCGKVLNSSYCSEESPLPTIFSEMVGVAQTTYIHPKKTITLHS